MKSKTPKRILFLLAFSLGTTLSILAIKGLTGALSIPTQSTQASLPRQRGETREAIYWPFTWDSIWNMPLGKDAQYEPIDLTAGQGLFPEEDILILEPNAPLENIYLHNAGWDSSKNRCSSVQWNQPPHLINLPIPRNFFTDNYVGRTPNHSAAILKSDGLTLQQTQPFHRCLQGIAVSQYRSPDVNIKFSQGIEGAHGGSGLSSMGGTIRLGELVPGGEINHALKINVFAEEHLFYDASDSTPGYRWPAIRADSYADRVYGGKNPALEMGTLLALEPDFDIQSLKTQPARIIATALKKFGAYIVDDTGWNVVSIATEWSPDGKVLDEFEQVWGFEFQSNAFECRSIQTQKCQWKADIDFIFSGLKVIQNNSAKHMGGPGQRVAPCAPPFNDGQGAPPSTSICP